VLAADVATGVVTAAEPVTHTFVNRDDDLLDLKVHTAGGDLVIRTTDHHPFYDTTRREWLDAANLPVGDHLATTSGAEATVVSAQTVPGQAVRYNLTVDVLHTYYVLAGATAVLVHNCPTGGGGTGGAAENPAAAGGGGAAESGGGGANTLFHYTDEAGRKGILDSGELRPSLKSVNPNDARYGNGQYLSDIAPGTKTGAQLSRSFLGHPFAGQRFTNYVEVDVSGLNVVQGRPGVFVVPGETPLDLTGRIVRWGAS
jgi:hypothetical protein